MGVCRQPKSEFAAVVCRLATYCIRRNLNGEDQEISSRIFFSPRDSMLQNPSHLSFEGGPLVETRLNQGNDVMDKSGEVCVGKLCRTSSGLFIQPAGTCIL